MQCWCGHELEICTENLEAPRPVESSCFTEDNPYLPVSWVPVKEILPPAANDFVALAQPCTSLLLCFSHMRFPHWFSFSLAESGDGLDNQGGFQHTREH